jgi:hypothetical protein
VAALRWADGVLWALDQTQLPWRETELALRTVDDVVAALRRLSIRGAPLIGVAAGYGVALELQRDPQADAARDRRYSRCSRIRLESEITSPSRTNTGTRRCPLSASTSSRRDRRCPTTTSWTTIPSRRSARATRPQGHSQSVGVLQR